MQFQIAIRDAQLVNCILFHAYSYISTAPAARAAQTKTYKALKNTLRTIETENP